MVQTRFSLDNTDEMQATLSHTMTVGDWKKLKEQMTDLKYPSCNFIRSIRDVITAAEKHFTEYDVTD